MQVTSRGPLALIPHYFLGAPGSQSWSVPAGFTLLWSPLCLHSSFPLTSSGLHSKSDTGLGDPLPSITGSQQGLQKQLEEAQCPGSATAGRNPLAAGGAGPRGIPWPGRRLPRDTSLSSVPISTQQSHSSSKMVSGNSKHSLACSRHLSLSTGGIFLPDAQEYYS